MHIISGKFRNIPLITPKGLATRPTSSQLRAAVFNIVQHSIEEAVFLDLFAGSGAMGFEALSRGAKKAIFIESGREAIKCIRQNAKKLQVESQCEIYEVSVFTALKKLAERNMVFDIVYADPPYESQLETQESYAQRTLSMLDKDNLVQPGGAFFLEDAVQTPIFFDDLVNLSLRNKRKMGRSILYQFVNGK